MFDPNLVDSLLPGNDLPNADSDAEYMRQLRKARGGRIADRAHPVRAGLPQKVDLSKHLRFIRWQSGQGCWGFARLAACDIMNEIACPYSPNLSLSLVLALFRNRYRPDGYVKQNGVRCPDGRWLSWNGKNNHMFLERTVGLPTEGTEVTCATGRWTANWTLEGVNEAGNYRFATDMIKIDSKAKTIMSWLAKGYPICLSGAEHVVAAVGYDANTKTFKIVDTMGDRAGDGGFFNFTFDQVGGMSAERFEIHTPKPIPAARIKVTTPAADGWRMNINLWLSVEGSPRPRRKIWPPPDSRDPSRVLHYTVRLPAEMIWPPTTKNRLVLDLYDSGKLSDVGGQIEEFTAAFGGHVLKCSNLTGGPVTFKAYQHKRLTIP